MVNRSQWIKRLRRIGGETTEISSIRSPEDIPPGWLEEFEERAAILEYDGGLTREDAETQAFDEIQKRMETNNWN